MAGPAPDRPDLSRRLLRRLEVQACDVERLLAGLKEEDLARRSDPEKWSLRELLAHLWITQRLFLGRLEKMLAEDNPAIDPYDPAEDRDFPRAAARPAARILAEFLNDRAAFVARLAALRPEDWSRSGEHPEFPNYHIGFLVEYMVHHEAHHLYQIFRLRSQLGAPL